MLACLKETTGPECRTNLDTHYLAPSEGWWDLYSKAPDQIIQPCFDKRTGDISKPVIIDEVVNKRVQVDVPAMDKEAFGRISEHDKIDPVASEHTKPACVRDLIRKLRWTNIGLEYHVSPISIFHWLLFAIGQC